MERKRQTTKGACKPTSRREERMKEKKGTQGFSGLLSSVMEMETRYISGFDAFILLHAAWSLGTNS
jgi:hypothetical protein